MHSYLTSRERILELASAVGGRTCLHWDIQERTIKMVIELRGLDYEEYEKITKGFEVKVKLYLRISGRADRQVNDLMRDINLTAIQQSGTCYPWR